MACGFKAIKIKIGEADLAQDIATLRAVRGIVGADIRLMVDFNQSLDVPEAVHRIQRLSDFDLHWIEEPVRAEDLAGHAWVRAATGAKMQTGENWWFPAGMAASIAKTRPTAAPDLPPAPGRHATWRAITSTNATARSVCWPARPSSGIGPCRHGLSYRCLVAGGTSQYLR